jgi:malto-oligosyltrehalose trehalohydrolase
VAQWCDDIHHVLHSAATGENDGYYADYAGDRAKIGRALAEGFVFQGEVMRHKDKARGKPSAHLPTTAFISFIQNHDQVGNRLFGDRLSETVPPERMKALAAIYLLAPQIPMILMGEEWAASSRFPYFCDFDEELNAAVREGRKREFGHDPHQAGLAADAPDPTTEATFQLAKLRWAERESGEHGETLAHYRRLLDLRREHILPLLDAIGSKPADHFERGDVIEVRWYAGAKTLILFANLGVEDAVPPAAPHGRLIYPEGDVDLETLPPWSVCWFVL